MAIVFSINADARQASEAIAVTNSSFGKVRRAVLRLTANAAERLVQTNPGNDCNDIYLLICPCIIQESDILLSTKNVASGNRQSG